MQHTTKQHYTPRFRFRFFEDHKLHYEFSKSGRLLGRRGIGNSIAVEDNLYEADSGEYPDNAIETGLFANDIEPRQYTLIKSIIKTVDARNVIVYRKYIENARVFPNWVSIYDDLASMMDISLLRQPYTVHKMKDMSVNKLDFFRMLKDYPDNSLCAISIGYVVDDSKLILSDAGMVYGTDEDGMGRRFMPLTPKICLIQTVIPNAFFQGNFRNPVLLEPIGEDFVKCINHYSIEQCEKKYVSITKDYTI